MKTIKKHYELFIVILAAILLYYFLIQLPGREAHTDVLWYLNMAMNNIQDPHWMTRYTHVYLQKIFMLFAAPLIALKLFWAFLVTSSAILVYWLSRTLTKNSTFISGLFSVLILATLRLFSESAGVALADITSMFIVLFALLIFSWSAKQSHKTKWLLILLGIIFVLALKTKETSWMILALSLGLIYIPGKSIDLKDSLHKSKFLLIGGGAGIVIFMVMNGIILGDIFFDFRPSNIRNYLSFYVLEDESFEGSLNFLNHGFLNYFTIPFILYFLSGRNLIAGKKFDSRVILFWLYPILLFLFLTAGLMKSPYYIRVRLLFPAFAVISIFAGQVLNFEQPGKVFKKKIFWISVAAMLTGIGCAIWAVKWFAGYSGVVLSDLNVSVIIPGSFVLFLCLVFLVKKMNWQLSLIGFFLISFFIYREVDINYSQITWEPYDGVIHHRFYPLDVYNPDIDFNEDVKIFISGSIPEGTEFFSHEVDTVMTIFDLHYGIDSTRENYEHLGKIELLSDGVVNGEIDYFFILRSESEYISPEIKSKCSIENSDEINVIYGDCR